MIHKNNCSCTNCTAKGSPLREIFLKEATAKILSEMEVFDWLEGYGRITSLAEQRYIRKYGFMLIKMQKQDDPQVEAFFQYQQESLKQFSSKLKKIEILQEQTHNLREQIDSYQASQLIVSERIHNLEEENGKYWEQIDELEKERDRLKCQRDNTLEQRTTDWDVIHKYEKDIEILKGTVENLKGEMIILQSRNNE